MGRIVIVPTLVAAAMLAASGSAAAERPPPSPWAAVAQYVEMLPTSTGPKAVGTPGPTTQLPASLAEKVARRGGPDAKALETLVTSSGWGAHPLKRRHTPSQGQAGESTPQGPTGESAPQRLAVPSPQASTSLAASVGGGLTSGTRAVFALVALLGLLAAAVLVRLRASR